MQLSVTGLKKYYTESDDVPNSGAYKKLVLDNINFSISSPDKKGKIATILAPLGAGKSTLLKVISGLEHPSEGKVLLNNTEYKSPDGTIVYIPEKPSSFPWYNVQENLEFVLKVQPGKVKSDLKNLISLVGLSGYEDHFPHNKSLGFRFRIALARALSFNPQLVLLDDCFKSMQPETKNEIHLLVKRISEELNINFLLATTSIHEAIWLSDQVFLMKKNPGTIFKEIDMSAKTNTGGIDAEMIAQRNKIEEYFRAEKIIDSVSFSL